MISGIIHFQLAKDYPSKVLYLVVSGKEKTIFWTKTDKHSSKHTGVNQILEFKAIIHQFPVANVPAGQYSFPFSFQIPEWAPPSFYYMGKR
jgi:hypothetical protein